MLSRLEKLLDSFIVKRLSPDDTLSRLLPATIALPLSKADIVTVEDLYECAANAGSGWYKAFAGIGSDEARALMLWLMRHGSDVGEVTPRFFPNQTIADSAETTAVTSEARPADHEIVPIESLVMPGELNGESGINRAPAFACSLDATNDLQAIRTWLNARAGNPNTYGNYRKEAERFLLWCLVEKRTALSSIKTGEASQYLRWLEDLGRLDSSAWARKWHAPQERWIGPKNAPRLSSAWRPFNGPLLASSRRNAIVVVRQMFNFLKKTGYLIFNPFDQVSPKVPLLKGEGAPQAFADRSLTEAQWDEIVSHLSLIPQGVARERMKLILMMGKSLGMRASEMLDARAGWIVTRRIGFRERSAIEIVGKGSKVRRLPLSTEQIDIINAALSARGLRHIGAVTPETALLVNLGRGSKPFSPMSRSGLYKVLERFFDQVALDIEDERPMDAAKLRASSTHWLRHTFAVQALTQMNVNIVQHAMGHASVSTTGRYLNPEEEEMSEAMAKLKAL